MKDIPASVTIDATSGNLPLGFYSSTAQNNGSGSKRLQISATGLNLDYSTMIVNSQNQSFSILFDQVKARETLAEDLDVSV